MNIRPALTDGPPRSIMAFPRGMTPQEQTGSRAARPNAPSMPLIRIVPRAASAPESRQASTKTGSTVAA